MINTVLRRKCCCTPKVKEWTATVCSNSCVVTCSGTGSTCIPTITFCDSYRQSIGLPDALDPRYCYIMILGGCLYTVNEPTYVVSCDATPTSTRNIGSLYGVFDQPEDGGCDVICTEIKDSDYLVGPDTWTGGFACGANITLTYEWPDAYCRRETFPGTVNGSCTPTCVDPCVKKIGTIVSSWDLGQFPDKWFSEPVQCSSLPGYCVNCGGYNPLGYTFWQGRLQNHQISSNYCPNLKQDVCNTPACEVFDDFSCSVSPVPTQYRTYTQAFTITRSCVYPYGDGTGWIDLGPGTNIIGIDGCVFRIQAPGCRASTLASAINNALGQAAQVGTTTFVSTGTNAWIGQACISQSCVGSSCLGSGGSFTNPYLWDGPYYSNSGRTATWYAAPWLTYVMSSSLTSTSFVYNDSEQGCICGPGDGNPYCSGTTPGSTFGNYVSSNLVTPPGKLIEYGVSFAGSDFTMVDDPSVSNQPCCPPPSIA